MAAPTGYPDFKNVYKPEEAETNPMVAYRLHKRGRIIHHTKESEHYQRYIKEVPRHARHERDPQTPDRFQPYTRKQWEALIKEWRLGLQKWADPEKEADGPEPSDPVTFTNPPKRYVQIDFIKKTDSYKEYIKLVPRHARQEHHPRTPERLCNHREWKTRLKKWRNDIEEWNPNPERGPAYKKDNIGDPEHPYKKPTRRGGRKLNRQNKKPETESQAPGLQNKKLTSTGPHFPSRREYLLWRQRTQSGKVHSEPPLVRQEKNKGTNVTQLEDDADLLRRCNSIRELIREHREEQQWSGDSSSQLSPRQHTQQLRSGHNREQFASMSATPARYGESVGGQHLAGPSGLFTANKEYESRISTSWVAASPAASLFQQSNPPPQTASTHQPASGIPQSSEQIADTDVLRLIRSMDAHGDEFDHFGKSIAARCRLLPSKVRSELQAVIEGAVAAYELANAAQLPSSAYVVDLIRNQCGASLSLPTGSLAPHLRPGLTVTQTPTSSLFGPVPLSSLPSQPPALPPSSQTVPPPPNHYLQPNPSASHLYSRPPPNYYTQPPPSPSVPPSTAAYFATSYKPQFK